MGTLAWPGAGSRSSTNYKLTNTRIRVVLTLIGSALLATVVHTSVSWAQTEYPVRSFARLPGTSNPQLSPDGKSLAIIQPVNGRRAITVYELDSARKPTLIDPGEEGDVRIAQYYWANNDRLVVIVAYPFTYIHPYYQGIKIRTVASRTLAVNKDGTNPVVLFKDQQKKEGRDGSSQGNILDLLQNDPDHILIAADINRDGNTTVNKVNVNTGKSFTVARGLKYQTYTYATDWDGNVRLRFDYDDVKDQTIIYSKTGETVEWTLLSATSQLGQDEIDPLGFSHTNPDHLFIKTRAETGRDAIFLLDVTTGEIVEKVFEHEHVDVDGMSFFHDTHEPEAVYYYDTEPGVAYLSERARKDGKIFSGIFGKDHTIYSRGGEKDQLVIILTTGEKHIPTFHLVDFDKKSVSELGRTWQDISDADVASVSPYYFKSRDGLEIPAYLTVPKGEGPFPTIIMPHGGPRARDDAEFDFMAQLFANRGYAVIKPNYRGSVGYGYEFEKAGYKQWGLKMQDDVTDATMKAIADGIADPDRICIVGWSYGAYAAMMGVVKEPDLYKCGAAINGVYDLIEVMNRPNFLTWYHNYWGEVIGDKDSKDRTYMEHSSPARRAGEITAPIFLAAGEIDRVVYPDQTKLFVKALKKSRKKYEVHYYPHGDHSLLLEPERIDMFEKLDKFLERHLK